MTSPLLGEKERKEILSESPFRMHDKWKIVEKYNVSSKTAERFMKKNNLIHTSSRNIECIMRYKKGEKVSDLAKEYGMSQVNLNALMKRRDIPQRGTQHFCNFYYFDEIDTEDKAYFLGFIYADGNLFRNSMKISIRDYDVDIIEKLKVFMNSNHPIYKKDLQDFKTGELLKEDGMVEIIITQERLPEIFNKHGVRPNKTHTLEKVPDTIPDNLFRHFLRGYIDGDGSFGKYKHNDGYYRSSLNIVGTENFLRSLALKVEELTEFTFNTLYHDRYPERKTNTRAINMTGKGKVNLLLTWLYQDSEVYGNRKYKKYLDMIK